MMVFPEQGAAMLASVLNSERAILVSIEVMRAFNQLRNMITSHGDLKSKLEDMGNDTMKNFASYSQQSPD
jgi:hypothetical protein